MSDKLQKVKEALREMRRYKHDPAVVNGLLSQFGLLSRFPQSTQLYAEFIFRVARAEFNRVMLTVEGDEGLDIAHAAINLIREESDD